MEFTGEDFLASHFKYIYNRNNYISTNKFVEETINKSTPESYKYVENLYSVRKEVPTLENFITQSIVMFTKNEKKQKGITYTPESVASLMAKISMNKNYNHNFKILDPAVGGGILLVSIAKHLKSKENVSVLNLIENHFFGMDIKYENVMLTKLSFVLLCLEFNENLPDHFNIIQGNALDWHKSHQSLPLNNYDIIICNPPYIRTKNLDKLDKALIKNNFETTYGLVDSYIPFYELGLKLLKENGNLTYISPNSFFRSLNGTYLRKYLESNSGIIKILNFNDIKLFNKISSYSTIVHLNKNSNEKFADMYYSQVREPRDLENSNWTKFQAKDTWRTVDNIENNIVNKLENNFTTKLDDLKFKNGIATQRNNIYAFQYYKEDEFYYYTEKFNKFYQFEKKVCKRFVTPNKTKEIPNQMIIFPYEWHDGEEKFMPISEEFFKNEYNNVFSYLLEHKEELSKRATDKFITNWYNYGRGQGLKDTGHRIYLPYIAGNVHTTFSKEPDEIFAAGYAIFHNDNQYLELLKSILESEIFTFYLSRVSKPYSGGFYSTAKMMIKNFSVPSQNEALKFKGENIKRICKLYSLNDEEINYINNNQNY